MLVLLRLTAKNQLFLRLLSTLFVAAVLFFPMLSKAELPKGNTFILVGKLSEGTDDETSYYIDRSSIQKKGNKLYYIEWAVWKNEQPDIAGKTWQYIKSNSIASCENWEFGDLNSSFINNRGQVVREMQDDGKMQNPQPDTIAYKTIDYLCGKK